MKAGDRVRVTSFTTVPFGTLGTVVKARPKTVDVQIDDENARWMYLGVIYYRLPVSSVEAAPAGASAPCREKR